MTASRRPAPHPKTGRPGESRRQWVWWVAGLTIFLAFVLFSLRGTLTRGLSVGAPLPEITLAGVDGAERSLDEWRGKALVLRFSSVSCTTCGDDFELLDQWQSALGERVQFVSVQVGDRPADVRNRLFGRGVNTPTLIDPDAQVARLFGVQTLPALFFVTTRGTLSSVVHSEVALTDIPGHVQLALSGGPTIDAELRRVSLQIRCQECEGRSVWESDAASSLEMRQRIYELLLGGRRADEVIALLHSEYGPWILMSPPASGFTALAWLLPAAALVGGAGVWWRMMRRARHVETPLDEGVPPETSHDDLVHRIDESLG